MQRQLPYCLRSCPAVPKRSLFASITRALYNEPYRVLPMRLDGRQTENGHIRAYDWLEPLGWAGMRATTTGQAKELVPGSKAEFITEQFWRYARQKDGGTIEYHVTHPRWRVWTSADIDVFGDPSQTYGPTFQALLGEQPNPAFVAEGSPITVMRPSPVYPMALIPWPHVPIVLTH